jgi:tetratricopeptide (TPR) repeat protein
MRNSLCVLSCCLVLLIGLAGCREDTGKTTKRSVPVAEEPAPLDDVMTLASEDRRVGDTNAAVRRLMAALADDRYEFQWHAVMSDLLQTRIQQGDLDAARADFLAADTPSIQVAQVGIGMLVQGAESPEKMLANAEWCNSVLEMDVSDAVVEAVYSAGMSQYLGTDATNAMWTLFEKGLVQGKIDAEKAALAIRPWVVESFNSANRAILEHYVALVRGKFGDLKPLASLATHAELAILKDRDYVAAFDLLDLRKGDLESHEIADYHREFATRAITAGDAETLARVLARDPELWAFVTERKISALINAGEWGEAHVLLEGDGRKLGESIQAKLITVLLKAIEKKDGPQAALNEALRAFEIYKATPAVAGAILRGGVKLDVERRSAGGVVTWLERGETMGMPPDGISAVLREAVYAILNSAEEADLQRLLDIGMRAREKAGEFEEGALGSVLLDLSFTLSKHESSIKLLEAGIKGRPDEWTRVMLNKVRAHHAMETGELDEAIARFQDFMQDLQDAGEDPHDPVAGEAVPVEMVLGFNEKRIGDLYAQQDKDELAALHYDRARAMYATAAARAETDTVKARIAGEVTEVPGS